MYTTSRIVELVFLKDEREQALREWYSSDRPDFALLIRLAYLGQRIQELERETSTPS